MVINKTRHKKVKTQDLIAINFVNSDWRNMHRSICKIKPNEYTKREIAGHQNRNSHIYRIFYHSHQIPHNKHYQEHSIFKNV